MRWRQSDQVKLGRYIGKFNAKITRLSKKMPEFNDSGILPERLNINEAKNNITDRKDFNNLIKRIDRFFKKGAEELVKVGDRYITKYEKNELTIQQRVVNTKRAKLRKYFGLNDREAARLHLSNLDINKEASKSINKKQPQNWYNFIYELNQESTKNYYNNTIMSVKPSYYKSLRTYIGGDEAELIIKMMEERGITSADILLAIKDNDAFSFEFIYSFEDRERKINILISEIEGRKWNE